VVVNLCLEVSDLFTLTKHELDALSPLIAWPMEHIEDANQVVFKLPTSSYPQWLDRERLMPNQQICKTVVVVTVKKDCLPTGGDLPL